MNIQIPAEPKRNRGVVARVGRKTLAATELLGRSIVAGHYPVEGVPVTEAELCRHFGFARGSLREAVSLLCSKGLVDRSPRLGLWVEPESSWNLLDTDILRWLLERTPSRKMIAELYELRLAIQPSAARLAATDGGGQARGIINSVLNLSAEDLVQSGTLSWPTNFHIAVLRATRNRWFVQMTELLSGALCLTDRFIFDDPTAAVLMAQYLPEVARSIQNADPDAAECNMRVLIAAERQLVLHKLSQ